MQIHCAQIDINALYFLKIPNKQRCPKLLRKFSLFSKIYKQKGIRAEIDINDPIISEICNDERGQKSIKICLSVSKCSIKNVSKINHYSAIVSKINH